SGAALYRELPHINADESARNLGVVAKHSLEKIAAQNVDCFTTVSAVTARECELLLGRKPDFITPNGFDISISDDGKEVLSLKKTVAQSRGVLSRSEIFRTNIRNRNKRQV
ncbi:MAG: hypothetical protein J6Q35_03285, partial [Rikenellaceae bacterium]|nr:hypothetical protein [Rikenellaceae bacterium]